MHLRMVSNTNDIMLLSSYNKNTKNACLSVHTQNINTSYPTILTSVPTTFMGDFRKFVSGALVKQY
jgi:hypothetical protein